MTVQGPSEDELMKRLSEWLRSQPEPPNILQILADEDTQLAAAFILSAFRVAAKEGVEKRADILRLRFHLLRLCGGDTVQVDKVLRTPHPRLDGRSPLQALACGSSGSDEILELIAGGTRTDSADPA